MSALKLSLAALSVSCALIGSMAPAHADWRYYGGEDWDGGYYPPVRHYRPAPIYRDDYQPYGGYAVRPWAGRRAYVPYDAEPDYYGPYDTPPMHPRVVRPPRSVMVTPEQPRRLVPPRQKSVVAVPPKKPVAPGMAAKPAPALQPAPVQEANVLPVPRPNLESMDFDTAK